MLPHGAIDVIRCAGCTRALCYRSNIDREELDLAIAATQAHIAAALADDALAHRRQQLRRRQTPNQRKPTDDPKP